MRTNRNRAAVLTVLTAIFFSFVLILSCNYSSALAEEHGEILKSKTDRANQADQADKTPTDKPSPAENADPKETEPAKKPFDLLRDNGMLIVMIGGIVLLYVFMGRSKRKQAAKRKEMLGKLAKGNKITTIGGIIGTVVEIRPDEVTLKVDETNNGRMHIARWAIRGVGEQAKTENPDQKS